MTPLEVITAARQFHNAVGDDFWSDAELYNHLYFAIQRLCREGLVIQNRYTTTSVADQQEYSRPTRASQIKRVEYDSRKLMPLDFRLLDSVNLDTTDVPTGTPQYFVEFDDVLILHPIPSTAGLTIKIYTYDYPAFPTATGTLEVPVQYHDALVFGVRALMSPKELGHPNTGFYNDEWEKAVRDVMRMEKRRKRGDKFRRVVLEEEVPNTEVGLI
jgi:hypothetical protein